MDLAGKMLRRSGARIKSIGTGHGSLQVILSELKNAKSCCKAFAQSQSSSVNDTLKWSLSDENRAIQDVFTQIAELSNMWTEAQFEFADHLKQYRHQFEMILEGEIHVDEARAHLVDCEARESKARKELKKAQKKSEANEQLEKKLATIESERDSAQREVVDRVKESEAVKLIRLKEGLLKLSESYLMLAQKCQYIFESQREIATYLPDVHGKEIDDVKYIGTSATKEAVDIARDKIQLCTRSGRFAPLAPPISECPPPYSPTPSIDSRLSYGFVSPYSSLAPTSADASGYNSSFSPGMAATLPHNFSQLSLQSCSSYSSLHDTSKGNISAEVKSPREI